MELNKSLYFKSTDKSIYTPPSLVFLSRFPLSFPSLPSLSPLPLSFPTLPTLSRLIIVTAIGMAHLCCIQEALCGIMMMVVICRIISTLDCPLNSFNSVYTLTLTFSWVMLNLYVDHDKPIVYGKEQIIEKTTTLIFLPIMWLTVPLNQEENYNVTSDDC